MLSLKRGAASLLAGAFIVIQGCSGAPADSSSEAASHGVQPKGQPSEKRVFVVALSWFSRVGQMNGSRVWRKDGFNYAAHKRGEIMNYPLPPASFEMPASAPAIGSPDYYRLQYLGAKEDLQLMKSAGFDVALYDMLPVPDYDPAKPASIANEPLSRFDVFLEWLKAAEAVDMKAGIFADIANQSAEYPKRRSITGDEWRKIISGALANLPDSKALWKENGVPAIMHFGSDDYFDKKDAPVSPDIVPDGGWRQVLAKLRADGKKFFFVADVRPHEKVLEWDSIADAVYIFAPAAPLSFLSGYQEEVSAKFKKPYYWFVSCGYYRGGTSYTEPDFKRVHDAYMSAIMADAKDMVVESWNDMNEDHDIWPSANKGSCLLDVFSYYNKWFKAGSQPQIEKEMAFICYPKRIPETVVTKAPVWGGGRWKAPAFSPKVFYWSLLKSPRKVEIEGVGSVQLPAGLSLGELGTIGKERFPETGVRLKLSVDGAVREIPALTRTKLESQCSGEGGLEFRYLDILARRN